MLVSLCVNIFNVEISLTKQKKKKLKRIGLIIIPTISVSLIRYIMVSMSSSRNSACKGFLIPGFVSVLKRQPARRAPVKRGTVFAGSGGSVLEAANWSKLSEACESSCLSH